MKPFGCYNKMKLFVLNRKVDMNGSSGSGIVAQGIVFDSGKVAMNWLGETSSVVIYDKIEDVEKIHGHGGSTAIDHVFTVVPDYIKPEVNDDKLTPEEELQLEKLTNKKLRREIPLIAS